MRYVVAAVVVIAMAIFGTVGTILVTSGRPLVMECQGLVTATCEEALEYWKDRFAEAGHSEPVMAFRFKSAYGAPAVTWTSRSGRLTGSSRDRCVDGAGCRSLAGWSGGHDTWA